MVTAAMPGEVTKPLKGVGRQTLGGDAGVAFSENADLGGSSGDEIFGVTTIMIDDDVSSGFVPPTAHQVFRGIELSGALSDFTESDDTFASYNPGFVIINTEAPVWLIFDAALSSDSPNGLEIAVESQAGTPGLTATLEAFNWNSSAYEIVDASAASFNTDAVVSVDLSSGISNFVQARTGAIRARIGWRQTGFTINFPWEVRLDQFVWTAN